MPASGCPATGGGAGEGEADADGLGVGTTRGFGDAVAASRLGRGRGGGLTEADARVLLVTAAGEVMGVSDETDADAGEVAGADATTGDRDEPAARFGLADAPSVCATAALWLRCMRWP